jgi:hypothetical protein
MAIEESATGSDEFSAGVIFPVSIQEAASVIDEYLVLKTLNV